jgi:hypothetical protein
MFVLPLLYKGWLSFCVSYARQVVELIIRLQVLNVISMRLIRRDDQEGYFDKNVRKIPNNISQIISNLLIKNILGIILKIFCKIISNKN